MIYAMSDIHGFLDVFRERLKWIDLSGGNRLVLLGDYIDYGPESGQTLRLVFETQKRYGSEKVIVLRGNHEEDFLEWLNAYTGPRAGQPDADGLIPWSAWLHTDPDYGTFRSLVTGEQWEFFRQIARTASEDTLNIEAAEMVLSANGELIRWLRGLPYFYETERQIFVHAGIDEDAGAGGGTARRNVCLSASIRRLSAAFIRTSSPDISAPHGSPVTLTSMAYITTAGPTITLTGR